MNVFWPWENRNKCTVMGWKKEAKVVDNNGDYIVDWRYMPFLKNKFIVEPEKNVQNLFTKGICLDKKFQTWSDDYLRGKVKFIRNFVSDVTDKWDRFKIKLTLKNESALCSFLNGEK